MSFDSRIEGKHSKVGLPGKDSEDFADGDWMIRVLLADEGTSAAR